jgi:hypothetical protein
MPHTRSRDAPSDGGEDDGEDGGSAAIAGSAAVRGDAGGSGCSGRVAESSSTLGRTGCVSIEVKPLGTLAGEAPTGAGTTGGSARVLASVMLAGVIVAVVAVTLGASAQPQLAQVPAPSAPDVIARPHC